MGLYTNNWFTELFASINGVMDDDNQPITFELKKTESLWRYYTGPYGELYCYTPHADTKQRYWCWTAYPVGDGSRSGKAKRWRMTKFAHFSMRRIAKGRALKRLATARRRYQADFDAGVVSFQHELDPEQEETPEAEAEAISKS